MRAILLLTCLAAGPAGAVCPAAGDLARGIRVAYAEGPARILRQGAAPHEVEARAEGPGPDCAMVLIHGLFPWAADCADVTDIGFYYDYGQDPATIPRPGPEQRIRTEAAVAALLPWDREETYDTGALRPVEVGGCRYDGFDITVTGVSIRDGVRGEPERAGLVYLPELGIAVAAWTEEDGVRSAQTVTAISALR